ncbi:peptidase M16 inactive domain protein [Gleimia coleocanis DSM 15436]|uniref:Peptidase M16 inactive domain protein n=1 Tax=Gleimia coleocanis DSM 15436 TaxID=525245 RepID=C0W0D4_9ACTO|nr:pitrilysin family protein [Gleimia coleocanis]EEH63993.1 peptidase M16 inactive domain protein [Gleimia coleocanis DSM 15436]
MNTLPLPLVASTDALATMTLSEGESTIKRTILPGGIRVLTHEIPAQRSVSMSIWCPVGSRDEHIESAGSTHFLEHLLFKGTKTRSSQDIANAFDEVGGESNAGTTKEYTYYWARILQEDLPMAVRVLADMVTSSVIDPLEFERERGVILDELAMGADDPTDVVHEGFSKAVFGDHPLGRPIGGDYDSINAAQRDTVFEYYQERYRPDTLVFVAAGAVRHEQLCEMVLQAMDAAQWQLDPQAVPNTPRVSAGETDLPVYEARDLETLKVAEQAHIVVGGKGINTTDERRAAMSVLLSVLGGSMSSRLFQEIREKRGLAYTTYAFDSAYTDAGSFGMYAGCAPKHLHEVEALMQAELEDLAANGPTEVELRRVKGQLRGGIALGLEDSAARMARLGRAEISQGRFTPLDLTISRLLDVTVADVASLASELLAQPWCRSVVKPA